MNLQICLWMCVCAKNCRMQLKHYLLSCRFHCRNLASPNRLLRHRSSAHMCCDAMVQCSQHMVHVRHSRNWPATQFDRWPATAFSSDPFAWSIANKSSRSTAQWRPGRWQRLQCHQQHTQIRSVRDTVARWTSPSNGTTVCPSSLWRRCQHYHRSYHKHRCTPFRFHWSRACIRIWSQTFRVRECSRRSGRSALGLRWWFRMGWCIRRGWWRPPFWCCDLVDMPDTWFVAIQADRSPFCIQRTGSCCHWDMYQANRRAMSILRQMRRPPLVWCGPMDRKRKPVARLVSGMCHVGMVRNDHRRPAVVRMSIHHGILDVMSLRPIVSFVPSHTACTRMNLRSVGRIHGRMNGRDRFLDRGICQPDSVLKIQKWIEKNTDLVYNAFFCFKHFHVEITYLCNQRLIVHLDRQLHQCDQQCSGIWSIVIVRFPIGMCLVGMVCMFCCSCHRMYQ